MEVSSTLQVHIFQGYLFQHIAVVLWKEYGYSKTLFKYCSHMFNCKSQILNKHSASERPMLNVSTKKKFLLKEPSAFFTIAIIVKHCANFLIPTCDLFS